MNPAQLIPSDPPAPVPPSRSPELANTELRDLAVEPSSVVEAAITIVHPQLRDLIVTQSRGHVYYPRGSEIKEVLFGPAHAEELRAAKLDGEDVSLDRGHADDRSRALRVHLQTCSSSQTAWS